MGDKEVVGGRRIHNQTHNGFTIGFTIGFAVGPNNLTVGLTGGLTKGPTKESAKGSTNYVLFLHHKDRQTIHPIPSRKKHGLLPRY